MVNDKQKTKITRAALIAIATLIGPDDLVSMEWVVNQTYDEIRSGSIKDLLRRLKLKQCKCGFGPSIEGEGKYPYLKCGSCNKQFGPIEDISSLLSFAKEWNDSNPEMPAEAVEDESFVPREVIEREGGQRNIDFNYWLDIESAFYSQQEGHIVLAQYCAHGYDNDTEVIYFKDGQYRYASYRHGVEASRKKPVREEVNKNKMIRLIEQQIKTADDKDAWLDILSKVVA